MSDILTRTVTITSASQPPKVATSSNDIDLLGFAATSIGELLPGLPTGVVNDIEDHLSQDLGAFLEGVMAITDTIAITWTRAVGA